MCGSPIMRINRAGRESFECVNGKAAEGARIPIAFETLSSSLGGAVEVGGRFQGQSRFRCCWDKQRINAATK